MPRFVVTLRNAFLSVLLIFLAACGMENAPEPDPAVQGGDSEADSPPLQTLDSSAEDLAATVERMGAIDRAYGGQFNPAGEGLIYISSETGLPQLFLAGSDDSEVQQLSDFEDQIRGYDWSPDGKMLAVNLAPGGGLNTQIYLMPATGGELELITQGGNTNNWLGGWSDDGSLLSYSSNRSGDGSMDAWLYQVDDQSHRMIADNPGIGTVTDISPDASRAVIWRMRSRGNTDLYLVDLNTGEEQLITPHSGVALSQGGSFVGNDRVIFSSNVDREMIGLAEVTINEEGVVSSLRYLAEREDAELAGISVSRGHAEAVLNWNNAGRSQLEYFDLDSGLVTSGPDLPAEIASVSDFSSDQKTLALTVSGSTQPANVWNLDRATNRFTRLTNSAHTGVDLDSLVAPELVRYPAHDGLELSGWLYRPPGQGPAAYVLDFHGGPEGQERPSFNSTIQALLSQNIGVFAPNVRGSSGFGKTFVNLDNGALRKDAIKDIKASADFLVTTGIADASRLGIMGGSYGGYMVMAGLTEYPDLFSAGANLFGVVNFKTFFENTEPWMAAISTVEYGDPATEAEMLEDLSPIHKVDRVKAPTIVLHGANDTNVPVVEAEQVVESLQQRGVPVNYILFPDEGHGWQKTENRITSTVEIVRWFDEHLATP